VAEACAVLACVLLAGLAVMQVGLAAGAPWGRLAWGGQHEVLPRQLRISSAVSVVVYAAMTLLILDAARLVDVLSEGFADVAIWVLTAYFALGVPLNAISRGRIERAVMTPVVLLLAVCCLVVALDR
jgi:hypothetical protein